MKERELPTIRELLDSAPERFGERDFIRYVHKEEIVSRTFSEVREDSLAACRFLRSRFPARTHAAVLCKSSYAYIVWLTGLLVGDFVAVPIPPETPAKEAALIAADADCAVLFYDAGQEKKAAEVRALCPCLSDAVAVSDGGLEELRNGYGEDSPYAPLSDVHADPEKEQVIIYTSGTTGEKKGVMLSGNALVGNVCVEAYDDVANRSDVMLSVLPLSHVFCFVSDYVYPLRNGNTVCLNGDMRDLFKNLRRFRPEQMRVVPTLAAALLARIRSVQARHPEMTPETAAAEVTGGNLKILFSGGAYLDPALCRAFDDYGIFLRQGYGMSEAGCKITVPDRKTPLESVGRLLNIVNVRVPDGEIQVDTPCRMLGYYKKPKLTEQAFTPDGWLKTGDLGYVTDDRVLFITGRKKNLIILGNGENVSPEAIERNYLASPLVAEVLVYAENGAITAEIYPDPETTAGTEEAALKTSLQSLTDRLNRAAPPGHAVAKLRLRTAPFEKTATGKVKRPTTL